MNSLKVCIECGDLADGTRCPACQAVANKRRGSARARGYDRAWEQRAATVKRRTPECVDCGSALDLTVDHVQPKVAGGSDELANLQTLCRRCNSSKGGRR